MNIPDGFRSAAGWAQLLPAMTRLEMKMRLHQLRSGGGKGQVKVLMFDGHSTGHLGPLVWKTFNSLCYPTDGQHSSWNVYDMDLKP